VGRIGVEGDEFCAAAATCVVRPRMRSFALCDGKRHVLGESCKLKSLNSVH